MSWTTYALIPVKNLQFGQTQAIMDAFDCTHLYPIVE
jgi:hypothetical protein